MAKHSYPVQKGRKLPIKRKSRKGRKSKWLPVVLNWIKKVFGDAGSAGDSVPALAREKNFGVAPFRKGEKQCRDGGSQGDEKQCRDGGHRDYKRGKNSEVIDGGSDAKHGRPIDLGWPLVPRTIWFGIKTGGIWAKGFGWDRPWGKPIVTSICLVLLLSACTATQVVGTLSSGGKVIKEYTRGQITYKQEHRALTRRTVERGQSILMAEAELLVRQGKHDEGIMVIEKTLKFLERNTPLLGQVLLDKDLLALKRARLDKEIRKLEPKK